MVALSTNGFKGVADIAAFPIFAAVMGAFGVVTLPLGEGSILERHEGLQTEFRFPMWPAFGTPELNLWPVE